MVIKISNSIPNEPPVFLFFVKRTHNQTNLQIITKHQLLLNTNIQNNEMKKIIKIELHIKQINKYVRRYVNWHLIYTFIIIYHGFHSLHHIYT